MFARQVLPKLMFQRLGLDSGLRLRFTLSSRGRALSSVCACVHAGPPAGIYPHMYTKNHLQVMAQTLCCKRKMRLKSPTTATPYISCWRY